MVVGGFTTSKPLQCCGRCGHGWVEFEQDDETEYRLPLVSVCNDDESQDSRTLWAYPLSLI